MNEQLELPLNDRRLGSSSGRKDVRPKLDVLYCALSRIDQRIGRYLNLPIGGPTIWCRAQIFLGVRSKYPPYDLL